MTPPIRGVLFDVDDTLVDTRGAFRHALAGVAVDYLGEVDHDELVQFWRDDANGWYRAHTRGEMTHREQRHRRANDLHAAYGGPHLDDAAYAEWDGAFERYFREGWSPYPDADGVLDALENAGIPYGALSNAAFDYQVLKLESCGLGRVPMLVGVDTLGFGKPDPRVFSLACERLGLEPAEVAYVGDEFDVDPLAAVAAGLGLGVWIERPGAHSRDTEGLAGHGVPRDGLVRLASLHDLPGVLGVR
ncbi:HAD family hydrolase [Demequina sp. SYSU T00039]|uniref:HAD family hydrolase n=1 Tax=Demequina lignilytica TaxID=3051663 RepID=A0AAW7M899_9MICO|nr:MULTISPECIES: HAD family hydrolase [unclassified Demequina]MDN4478327.1 HAD family hydrolase [Demequina sp. SYSU T00039-1]MDN4487166.1 HAD family hydrolase [Demequina sp. SYSU T00039]MDN4489877.1 HAD family hydrolase [Demequina sp. SYSU T00068]